MEDDVLTCPFCGKAPHKYMVGARPYFNEKGIAFVKCKNVKCAIWDIAIRLSKWQSRLMTLAEYLQKTEGYGDVRPLLFCHDGTYLSVQAGSKSHSTPKLDTGPYTTVEVGRSSRVPPKDWGAFFYGDLGSTSVKRYVYEYVPVEMVQDWIDKHGGVDYVTTMEKSTSSE